MYLTVCIEGLNLEKLLRAAMHAGITLRCVSRIGLRQVYARVYFREYRQLEALCSHHGWQLTQIQAGWLIRAGRFYRKRIALFAGMIMCVALVYLSSGMILRIRIEHARENEAEVRRFLSEEGVRIGRLKSAFSSDTLRERMAVRLPGLAFSGLRYEGSTLVVDCRPAQDGENVDVRGTTDDIVAVQEGIITRISVQSGTPQVRPGDAVCRGQVLISGYERTEKGEQRSVRAQGQVSARVWAKGSARTSLMQEKTVETGALRRRVELKSLWHQHMVRDAVPFASQDVSSVRQMVVGLYLPLWREITTYAETVVSSTARSRGDAASWAQAAAEEIAKKQCPFDALILDKWVDYSMIDNEFLYAAVVLEYEASIAGRLK